MLIIYVQWLKVLSMYTQIMSLVCVLLWLVEEKLGSIQEYTWWFPRSAKLLLVFKDVSFESLLCLGFREHYTILGWMWLVWIQSKTYKVLKSSTLFISDRSGCHARAAVVLILVKGCRSMPLNIKLLSFYFIECILVCMGTHCTGTVTHTLQPSCTGAHCLYAQSKATAIPWADTRDRTHNKAVESQFSINWTNWSCI